MTTERRTQASTSRYDAAVPAHADPDLDDEDIVDKSIVSEQLEGDANIINPLAAGATPCDLTSDVRGNTPCIAGPSTR
ncbi:hypothetical protein FRC07_002995, partial [Ceratobasidium sp. 392]